MTTRDLLAEAYDAEQAGNHTLAAELRAQCHSGQQQAAAPVVRITEDGTPNKYDTGEYSMEWTEVRTPLVTLADDLTIAGTYDVDGSRYSVCVETEDGQLFAGRKGVISGSWAGIEDVEIDPVQLATLRALFTGDLLPCLLTAGMAWEDRTPRRFDEHGAAAAQPLDLRSLSAVAAPPTPPTVRVETIHDTDGTCWHNFLAGDGLTRVEVSPNDDRPGVHLAIGTKTINTYADEIITLDDVRQLRDNLTALLNDPRLSGGPVPPAPLVSIEPCICDDRVDKVNYGKQMGMDYVSGDVMLYVPDEPSEYPIDLYISGHCPIPLHEIEQALPAIFALLADPRVQAERARYEAASAHLMKKAA